MNWRTLVAKAVYRVGGWLIHVKTHQGIYEMHWHDENEDPSFVLVGKSWESIGWAWDLLEVSERLDPRHWEHWAMDHSDCESPVGDDGVSACGPCSWCGGVTCYRDAVGDEP